MSLPIVESRVRFHYRELSLREPYQRATFHRTRTYSRVSSILYGSFPANCFCNVLRYVRECKCYRTFELRHGCRCLCGRFDPNALVQIIPEREKLGRFVTFDVFGRRVYICPCIARTVSTLDFKVYTEVPVVGRFVYARLCCRRKVRYDRR